MVADDATHFAIEFDPVQTRQRLKNLDILMQTCTHRRACKKAERPSIVIRMPTASKIRSILETNGNLQVKTNQNEKPRNTMTTPRGPVKLKVFLIVISHKT